MELLIIYRNIKSLPLSDFNIYYKRLLKNLIFLNAMIKHRSFDNEHIIFKRIFNDIEYLSSYTSTPSRASCILSSSFKQIKNIYNSRQK